jgi:hypothetical protein
MNNWFGKSECTANVDKLRGFYERVLDSFLEKIYKENRFKMSGGLDEQKIDQLGDVPLPPPSTSAPTSRNNLLYSISAST